MKVLRVFAVLALLVLTGACAKSSTPEASTEPTEAATTTAPAASPAGSAAAGATTVKIASSSKGQIYTSSDGKSLYTFDNDDGKSNCTGACATTWPALAFTGSGTPTGASGLATITRDDGTKQVTWNGKPLYNYSGDTAAGDVNGDGIGGKWHVAKAA